MQARHRRRRAAPAAAAGAVPGRRPPHLHVRQHRRRRSTQRRPAPTTRSLPRCRRGDLRARRPRGRNCYTVSTDASATRRRARLDLEVSLRHGLDEDELELHYQPIVTADGGARRASRRSSAGASPQRGVLWPAQFVPVAEETGLIVPMGRWVLEEACRDVRAWTLATPSARRYGLGQPVGPPVRPAPAGRGGRRDAPIDRPAGRPSCASRSPRPS